ncbi:MAG: prepilin-type N-terminal cleavage/methylation domain-containing protein [Verrucomicrobiaceae bacterium]|nr:prepilin-type N-terminal cleavage/methylation domain-containing protein [Verrucomicrobiaceae bacterium]
MKNTKLNLKKAATAGFSLIEMLVVIAVIGVIAAIAIPNIGNINSSAIDSAGQRNAQSVASVYSAGLSAGCPVASDLNDALAKVGSGTWAPESGAFSGRVFLVPNLPADPSDGFTAMMSHLDWDAANKYVKYLQVAP